MLAVRPREDGVGSERCPEVPETSVLGGTRRASSTDNIHIGQEQSLAAARERAWQRRLTLFRQRKRQRTEEAAVEAREGKRARVDEARGQERD